MTKFKNKQILVTGGAGFIGSHLVGELIKQEAQVSVLDVVKGEFKKAHYIVKNINDYVDENHLKKFDYIFHLAGRASVKVSLQDPLGDVRDNLENTIILLEALKNLKKKPVFVFASTAAVYGIQKKMPLNEKNPVTPLSPYGINKLAAENYIRTYSELYNIPVIILRFFSVYGPGQEKQVVFDLMSKIKKNPRKLEVLGSPNQTLDLIFIDDLIKATLLLTSKNRETFAMYNIAFGKSHKISQIVQSICQAFQVSPSISYGDKRPGTNQKWQIDISKIKNVGFKPEVDLAEGIEKTKAWFTTSR